MNERIEHYVVPYIIVAICALLLIVYRKFPLHHHEYSFDRKTLVLWIPIAAIITYLINNQLGLGGVFSAGIIGTLGSFLTKFNPRSEYLKQIAGYNVHDQGVFRPAIWLFAYRYPDADSGMRDLPAPI